jgi:hypothetical protein
MATKQKSKPKGSKKAVQFTPDEVVQAVAEPSVEDRAQAAMKLAGAYGTVTVSFTWFGVDKALSEDQNIQAAAQFDADADRYRAAKKLLDTRDPAMLALTNVRHRIKQYRDAMTLPWITKGQRLIHLDAIAPFEAQMTLFQEELNEAVRYLDGRLPFMVEQAREKMGHLFDEADYPESIAGYFTCRWEFGSAQPPAYMAFLDPNLGAKYDQMFRDRLDLAVRKAEQEFTEEFSKIVSHLAGVLGGHGDDGKPKKFWDETVYKLHDFFDRFSAMSLQSNPQLELLVQQAKLVVAGSRSRTGSGRSRTPSSTSPSRCPNARSSGRGRDMSTPECYYCERRDNLEQQLCGFWFCFRCLPRAMEKGAWYWRQMYRAVREGA